MKRKRNVIQKNEKELRPNYLGKTDQGLSKLENIDERFQFANVFFSYEYLKSSYMVKKRGLLCS